MLNANDYDNWFILSQGNNEVWLFNVITGEKIYVGINITIKQLLSKIKEK
jgi:hypothetical protein